MNRMRTRCRTLRCVLVLLAIAGPSWAAVHVEAGDAADLMAEAQWVGDGSGEGLTAVQGTLDAATDLDYYLFRYQGNGELRIDAGPYYAVEESTFPLSPIPGFELLRVDGSSLGGVSVLNGPQQPLNQDHLVASEWWGTLGVYYYHFTHLASGNYLLRVDGAGHLGQPQLRYQGDYALRFGLGAVLAPVPEPPAFLMLLAGLLAMLGPRLRSGC